MILSAILFIVMAVALGYIVFSGSFSALTPLPDILFLLSVGGALVMIVSIILRGASKHLSQLNDVEIGPDESNSHGVSHSPRK